MDNILYMYIKTDPSCDACSNMYLSFCVRVDLQNHQETCPLNEYPLKLPFYIYFLFLIQNIDCGYSTEPPR